MIVVESLGVIFVKAKKANRCRKMTQSVGLNLLSILRMGIVRCRIGGLCVKLG